MKIGAVRWGMGDWGVGVLGNDGAWLHGCMAAWVHGCMDGCTLIMQSCSSLSIPHFSNLSNSISQIFQHSIIPTVERSGAKSNLQFFLIYGIE
jgi:hypothetical protein